MWSTFGLLVIGDLLLAWLVVRTRAMLLRDPLSEPDAVRQWCESRFAQRGRALTRERVERSIRRLETGQRWFPLVYVVMTLLCLATMVFPLDRRGDTLLSFVTATHPWAFGAWCVGVLVMMGESIAAAGYYSKVEIKRLSQVRAELE